MSGPSLREGLLAGGAPRIWERAVRESLPFVSSAVPPGSRVLEVGYGNGLLSCYLASELGWVMTGLDIRPEAGEAASAVARQFGVEGRTDFRVLEPEQTRRHQGIYDAVFIKTVVYASRSPSDYAAWLDWIGSVLRPAGVLVNYETGRANRLMQAYRRLRGREYTDLCLYTREIEMLYDERFEVAYRRYYGGFSQFLAPFPGFFQLAAALEAAVSRRSASNCFIVAMVARKAGRAEVPSC